MTRKQLERRFDRACDKALFALGGMLDMRTTSAIRSFLLPNKPTEGK